MGDSIIIGSLVDQGTYIIKLKSYCLEACGDWGSHLDRFWTDAWIVNITRIVLGDMNRISEWTVLTAQRHCLRTSRHSEYGP